MLFPLAVQLLAEHERLVVVYVLVDGILNPHEPTLNAPVHCVPPFELGGERDSDPQDAASDRLNRCLHREVWQGL